jgi:hypothetical protein
MRIGLHNVTQLTNGDWTEYRYFGGDRYLFYKKIYSFEKEKLAKEKEAIKSATPKRKVSVRVVKASEGWTIWYRRE